MGQKPYQTQDTQASDRRLERARVPENHSCDPRDEDLETRFCHWLSRHWDHMKTKTWDEMSDVSRAAGWDSGTVAVVIFRMQTKGIMEEKNHA